MNEKWPEVITEGALNWALVVNKIQYTYECKLHNNELLCSCMEHISAHKNPVGVIGSRLTSTRFR